MLGSHYILKKINLFDSSKKRRRSKMSLRKILGVASAVFFTGALLTSADADVYIGLGAVPVQVAAGATSANFFGPSDGFTISSFGIAPPAPQYLISNSIAVTTESAGSVTIYVTATNLTQSLAGFLSGFATNFVSPNFTVTEQAFLDTGNGLFTTSGILLGSATFGSGAGDFLSQVLFPGVIDAPFSITEVYTITANAAGTANLNINVSAVPEASTWAMILLGFLGVGVLGYRRNGSRAILRVA